MTTDLLERVRSCKHCERDMAVTGVEHSQNPYCGECLRERVALVQTKTVRWTRIGRRLIPVTTDD